MNGNSEKPGNWSWLWKLLILLLLGGFLLAIAIPSYVEPPTSKVNSIINNLHHIDMAKNEWAFEHGVTNYDQIASMTNQLSEQDLTPYLHFPDKQGGLVHSVAGEIYLINPLNKTPGAKLVHKINMPWPKGSMIRFLENTNAFLEITFPDGTKTNY
jgi:hypothetical protein